MTPGLNQDMRAAVLRYIDKWVGISLCYLLTVLDNVRRVLFPTDDHYKPSKILFLSVVELGALSVAFSAINSAKRNFPEAKVYIFTTSLGEELCEIMGFGSEQRIIISSVENPWRFMWDSFKAVFKLNRIGIDAAVCLDPYLRYSAIMSYLSGSKIRSGFHRFSEEGNYIGNLFTHKLIYNPHLHVGLSYMSLVEALKERTDHEPKVKRPIQYAELERFVARHTSTGLAAIREVLKKHYPEVEGQKIIRASSSNIKKTLQDLFGRDNIPNIGKRKSIKTEEVDYLELNLNNPMIDLKDMFIQKIIDNNISIFRGYSNGYYWIKNKFYDYESRNIGFYSPLQSELANNFKSLVIDWLSDPNKINEITPDMINEMGINRSSSDPIREFINRLSNDVLTISNGVTELTALSKINDDMTVVVRNDSNVIMHIFNSGTHEKDPDNSIISKYDMKKCINLKFEYVGNSTVPDAIEVIYYKDQ